MKDDDWARLAVADIMRQTAISLVARRERERVEAERWLRQLRAKVAERREAEERERKRQP